MDDLCDICLLLKATKEVVIGKEGFCAHPLDAQEKSVF